MGIGQGINPLGCWEEWGLCTGSRAGRQVTRLIDPGVFMLKWKWMTCWEQGPQALSVHPVLQLPVCGATRSILTGINQGLDFFKERNDPVGPSVCTKS